MKPYEDKLRRKPMSVLNICTKPWSLYVLFCIYQTLFSLVIYVKYKIYVSLAVTLILTPFYFTDYVKKVIYVWRQMQQYQTTLYKYASYIWCT